MQYKFGESFSLIQKILKEIMINTQDSKFSIHLVSSFLSEVNPKVLSYKSNMNIKPNIKLIEDSKQLAFQRNVKISVPQESHFETETSQEKSRKSLRTKDSMDMLSNKYTAATFMHNESINFDEVDYLKDERNKIKSHIYKLENGVYEEEANKIIVTDDPFLQRLSKPKSSNQPVRNYLSGKKLSSRSKGDEKPDKAKLLQLQYQLHKEKKEQGWNLKREFKIKSNQYLKPTTAYSTRLKANIELRKELNERKEERPQTMQTLATRKSKPIFKDKGIDSASLSKLARQNILFTEALLQQDSKGEAIDFSSFPFFKPDESLPKILTKGNS